MPNRIIKQSICKSESIKKLSWFEEAFFYRLIVNCDDYGRADARLDALASDLFPVRREVTLKQVGDALNKLVTVGIVRVYEYDRQPYLQLLAWDKHQTIRNHKSKYPPPPEEITQPQADVTVIQQLKSNEINCTQPQATASRCYRNPIQSESESESESKHADARDDADSCLISEIVDYLNYKAETSFKSSSANTKKHINARLNEGYSLDDFKTVIDKKVNEWKNSDMAKYIRPETLFGNKFEGYLNQKATTPKSNNPYLDMLREEYEEELNDTCGNYENPCDYHGSVSTKPP